MRHEKVCACEISSISKRIPGLAITVGPNTFMSLTAWNQACKLHESLAKGHKVWRGKRLPAISLCFKSVPYAKSVFKLRLRLHRTVWGELVTTSDMDEMTWNVQTSKTMVFIMFPSCLHRVFFDFQLILQISGPPGHRLRAPAAQTGSRHLHQRQWHGSGAWCRRSRSGWWSDRSPCCKKRKSQVGWQAKAMYFVLCAKKIY